ncbi:MAG: hypothetical protein AAF456_20325 [Planctomycetota bacterium]
MFCSPICRYGVVLFVGFLVTIGTLVSTASGDPTTGWDIGQRLPDFAASYVDQQSGVATSMSWYDEGGADAYALSLCGMWCAPCQLFAEDSGATTAQLQSEGINVQMYDLVFQNVASQEPQLQDINGWIDQLWTSDPENVLFAGDIPLSAEDSIAEEILLRSNFGIPAFLIVDRNMVITDYQTGYFGGTGLMEKLRVASVPEPAAATVLLGVIGMLSSVRKRRVHF